MANSAKPRSLKWATTRIPKAEERTSRNRILVTGLIILLICYIHFYCPSKVFPSNISGGWVQSQSQNGPIADTIELPIDHFNQSDIRTFSNRYWMNDTHYRNGGPVFFFDGGEAGLGDRAAAQMLGGNAMFAPLELARKYHGIAIIWEHRFFGGSMPFSCNETTGIAKDGHDAYKYLNNEQALEDAAYFAQHFQPPGHDHEDLSSESVPWIAMGGSYAGLRAAMLRIQYPEVFLASWSSSAPVQTRVENSEYWNNIIQEMPKNCSSDVHAAITYAEELLLQGTDDETALLKKALFLTNNASVGSSQDMINVPGDRKPEDITYFDAALILATPFHTFPTFQSVGYKALNSFCNYLETWNPDNATEFTLESPLSVLANNSFDSSPAPDGIRAKHGPKSAFYAFISASIQISKTKPGSPSRQVGSMSDRASWNWMLCYQFGQYQVSQYPSPNSIISRFNNITSFLESFCHSKFSYAPEQPKVSEILKYGGWDMRPTNIMFTNGEIDPWRALSIQSSKSIHPNAPDRKTTNVVQPCNVPPPGDEVFGIVHKGSVHVEDQIKRGGDPVGPIDDGLELFGKALDVWLPCFQSVETIRQNTAGSQEPILVPDIH